jgi:ribosomal peptide maturation radical SAM protein 1
MPFGPVFGPSLGLGLLRAQLERAGVAARSRYFTIAFAEIIGDRLYDQVAMTGTLSVRELAGEWLFSSALFDQTDADVDGYVDRILRRREGHLTATPPAPPALVDQLLRARARVGPFLDRCLDEVVAAAPRVLGFTSVFQQHVASLALARRVKAVRPDTVVVFGGANCEGVMGAETLRQFAWVDVVVSGEADELMPELTRRLLAGGPVDDLRGVLSRAGLDAATAAGAFPSAAPVRRMDDLPYPDYDEYFEQFGASRFDRSWQPGLFVETSRGCWWGERQHCTFCGLNGATMTYRSKSPARALDELTTLAARYPDAHLQVVDNILDLGYFKTLLPELAARKLDFGLFYETKSNLKQEQIRLLRDAGVRTIQPGVESFSDEVLALMRKGVTGLQNIQALKWCKQYGVTPLWNLIWGFPGEPTTAYAQQAELVPRLEHLPPPAGCFGLRLDRFSPNFEDAEALGFTGVAPLPAYEFVYPFEPPAVANLAYYFQFATRGPHPGTYVGPLLRALETWKRRHRRSELLSMDLGDALLVWDLRSGRAEPLAILRDLERELFLACESVSGEDRLLGPAARGRPAGEAEAMAILERLVAAELVVRYGRRYLNLAVPIGDYQPSGAVRARIDAAARQAGVRIRRPARAATSRRLAVDDFSFDRHGELVVR